MQTYDEIYERMKNKYIEESGDEFDNASDVAIRLKVLAGEIYNAYVNMEWLKNQMFVKTASGEYLDYFASQRGLARKNAVAATGELTFYVDEVKSYDVAIPKGTVVATSDSDPVRFVTTEDGMIMAGGSLVSLYADAEVAGRRGNAVVGVAVVPVNVPSEVSRVTNREAFVGGVDEETDDELRERIISTFKKPSNGTNVAYYEDLALSIEGISKAGVYGRVRGVGTVDVYVCGNGVACDSSSVNAAQNLISKNRELNVDVKVIAASPYAMDLSVEVIGKKGYSPEYIKERCIEEYKKCLAQVAVGGSIYLSTIGNYFMNTGCIEDYTFNTNMENHSLAASQFFVAGEIDIKVS